MLKIPLIASLALFVASGGSFAAGLGNPLYRQANVAAPWGGLMAADQQEVITPPGGIDPDITIAPPATGARMPILRPPAIPGGKSGLGR